MALTRLQDDLLQDFKEQKRLLTEQIELFDPLATCLRKPAAQRLMDKGGLIVAETFCYLLSTSALAFTIMMNMVYPFGPLNNVRYLRSVANFRQLTEAEYFSIAVHGMGILIALLFFILARTTRRIRLKNDILNLAGKNIKELVGQHLQRRAAIEAIEQRHFQELPTFEQQAPVRVNTVPNPGYDSQEAY